MSPNHKIKELNDTFRKVLDACPEIVYMGNPVLRQKAEEVNFEEGSLISQKLISVLQRYRAVAGVGRGIAAPQIGLSKTVFVTFVNNVYHTYINPQIKKVSDTFNLYVESCLSCGYLATDVKRHENILIEYTDENAIVHMEKAEGFLARLLQHEYDHLEGIINIDKAEPKTTQFMTDDPLKQTLRKWPQ